MAKTPGRKKVAAKTKPAARKKPAAKTSTAPLPADVAGRWTAIAAWLDQRAPWQLKHYRAPASAAAIADAERVLGRALPDDYKEFLALHDGSDTDVMFVEQCSPMAIGAVPRKQKDLLGLIGDAGPVAADEVDPEIRPVFFSPGWIPIAVSPRGRDFLCIDFDPTPAGRSGQIILVVIDFDTRKRVAADFTDLLGRLFAELQSGEIEIDDEYP
jgi:cell wall assembly regulator SMI1